MDLSEVIESFFIESQERLDLMESGLLKLKPGELDAESINDIFRAAHSIKGGGGIFGFGEVSDFMHGVETLLDQLRGKVRPVTQEITALLLEAVDCTREMLNAAHEKRPHDAARASELERQMLAILGDSPPPQEPAKTCANIDIDDNEPRQWHIYFKPHPGMLAKANDPLRMIRDLEELGDLKSSVDISDLPDFSEVDPTECYLSWKLTLTTEHPKKDIEEVFAWVADECDLEISTDTIETAQHPTEGSATQQQAPQNQDVSSGQRPKTINTIKSSTATTPSTTSESIRVSIDKIDDLINLIGELVITQSMLSNFNDDGINERNIEQFRTGLSQLIRNTRDLQNSVLKIRMLPISFCFNRFPRLVHDISHKLGKKVQLTLSGEDTELDKTVLERITDPLIHLVRNSLDHGLETPEQRRTHNKPEQGRLDITAYHESGNIAIEVIDDGAGLNTRKIRAQAIKNGLITEDENLNKQQIHNLIFSPGFSTADSVSNLSGRGVGMDVVKRNINDLGGDVWLESEPGEGTRVSIRLPLTLAILDGQLLRVGEEVYIMPLMSIIETLQVNPQKVNTLPGDIMLYRLRDTHIPIIKLSDEFSVGSEAQNLEDGLLVIVDSERQHFGIWVDELLDQQQVVIKSLESNFAHVKGLSGATILGDGTVALILDVNGIIENSGQRNSALSLEVA